MLAHKNKEKLNGIEKLTFVVCASLAFVLLVGSPGFAETFTAEQFALDDLVGKVLQADGSGTETEHNIWLVESVGPVKLVMSEEKYHYDMSFDDGNSAMSAQGWYEETFLTVVPEPATMGLLTLGGLAVLRRRRKA